MTFLHSWRSVGQLLIGVLISTQVAIAAHACAGPLHTDMSAGNQGTEAIATMVSAGPAGSVAPEAGAATDVGEGMDADLSSLCVAHCQKAQPSADQAQSSAMPAVLVSYLYAIPPLSEHFESPKALRGPGHPPPVAADQPHSILHCCLRN